jgi:diacylglycerol kinase (ATP)
VKILILTNPSAGGGKARRVLQAAVSALRRRGEEPQILESQSPQHLVELARASRDENADVIVCAGGDGTIHQILNGLLPTETPLGIIPLGRGNDLARGLGIPTHPGAAAELLLKGKTRLIDLARAGSGTESTPRNESQASLYAGIAGVGFDSVATRFANQPARRLHGRLAYAWGIMRCLRSYQAQPLELTSDTRNFSGEVMFAVVANNSAYGDGLKIAPGALLDDGLLDVCIIPAMSKWELLRWVPSVYRGRHIAHNGIIYFKASRVTLRSAARLELFGDGEFLGELPATLEVLPRALRVIAPA